jgi:replication-associated recombination protein RarA
MAKGSWRPQLKSGAAFDEVISGIQKTIRRGMEREALILAQEMFDSGYHSALARRLLVLACEDVGLANPTVVSQVYTLCTGYIVSKKDSPTGRVEPLALIMSIILLARSPKNRECDDAQIVTIARMKAGKDTAENVIRDNPFIVDQHTQRGKVRLASQAAETGHSYDDVAMREFLTIGTQLIPHVEVNDNPWGREVREMYGLKYEKPGCDRQPEQSGGRNDESSDM